VSTEAISPPRESAPRQGTSLLARALRAATCFAFAPASAAPLAVLRIGLASVLLVQAALVYPALHEIYSQSGILQGSLGDAFLQLDLPRIGWLIALLAPLGLPEATIITATGVVYVLSLAALLAGWRTRLAAGLCWFTHLMLMVTVDITNYGADIFANIFLFYLIWVPSGAALSLDRRRRRASAEPTTAARLGLRVIQIHLCIAYLASGLHKAAGEQWWNGEAIWRSLMLPGYRQLDFSWLAYHPWIAMILGWTVLLIEIGYPFLIWPRLTRRLWVAATVALHVGIAVFMSLGIFGAIMSVLTVAAFAVSAEPGRRSLVA